MKTKHKFIFLACLLGTTLCTHAAIYKWTDANGDTQYSENPPANVDATPLSVHTAPSSSASDEIKKYESIDKNVSKNIDKEKAEKEKAAVEAKNEEIRKYNCQEAKNHLENMGSKQRVRLQQANGEYQVLTPEQRDDDLKQTKINIEKFCSPAKPDSTNSN